MKGFLRRLCCLALGAAMITGAGAAGTRLPILMYHHVAADGDAVNSMTVTDERFRLDMEFLQQFGYTPLLPAELIEIRAGRQAMPDKPVMVTFDDGYRSNYQRAYPTLLQTGMKAAIAVVTSYIRPADSTEWDRNSLTWGELREMADSGAVEVGSHTHNLHNPASGGDLVAGGVNGVQRRKGETQDAYRARVGQDLRTSVQLIRDNLGREVHYFSYPFGAYDAWSLPVLDELQVGVTTMTNAGTADIANGLRRLPRYRVTMDRPLSDLLRQQDIAHPVPAAVTVNGVSATLQSYRINGRSFVRVRDVAMLLRGTSSEFAIGWDEGARRVSLSPFSPYTPRGDEGKPLPAGKRTVRSLVEPTVVSGRAQMVAAYNIDRSTFYQLRSLSTLCGFIVDWDEQSKTIWITA